ncbi:MAG: type 4a pilus biogenesis protein PilO [Candidatus Omnitrophica bacterium]|nr:type 4a pilus biogenesis protein PilO [Candidatus Omnitrophota bacterium]MDE2222930.1 type 4a pilus biogenesis protein PilO [Candidatus Omnitrophota bacterium]
MKKLSRREMIILTITVGLFVIFILVQGVIRPIHEGAMNVDDELRLVDQKLQRANQLVAQGPAIEGEYKKFVQLVGVAGPEDEQMPAMVSRIESAAKESNIHISNMQPRKSTAQKGARFLSVELQVDGEWLDMVRFLSSLQAPPNFYFINDLSLEKYSEASGALHGRIVLSVMGLVNP